MTDQQLLRDYVERRSEAAFAELVRRHIDLTYSAALRMVCDSHLAEDVTQRAFVALARSARQLSKRAVLSGWLHRTAQNIAAQTVRTDVRRRAREQEAAAMNELFAAEPDGVWEHIAPHLDAALGELSDADRDALMLRYFQRKSAQEMAQVLGISDEAAQKRVSRAVERLREFFAKRGVTVGTSGLVVAISANAVQVAPAGLSAAIALAASTATTLLTTTTVTVGKAAALSTMQKTFLALTVALVIGLGIQKTRQVSQLRNEVDQLTRSQVESEAQVEEPQAEPDEVARLSQTLKIVNVLPLREGITQSNLELAKRHELATPPPSKPLQIGERRRVENFQNLGAETIEAAFESVVWAARNAPEQLTNLVHMPAGVRSDPARLTSDPPALAKFLNGVVFGISEISGELSIRNRRGPSLVELRSTKAVDVYYVYDDAYSLMLSWFNADGQESVCQYNFFFRQFPGGRWCWMIPEYSPSTAVEGLGGPLVSE